MSEKELQNQKTQEEKVVTKYDLKMQRREAEKAKAKKEERASRIAGIAVVLVLLCIVVSFPVRSWLTVNGTFIEVGGDKVSRLEFDYNYNIVMNNYLNENGYYMSYLGIDLTKDLSTQMYTENLSFQDFFEEMAVEAIVQNRALKAEAAAAGFTYDATADYEEYEAQLKEAAKEAGVSVKEFVKNNFGSYATPARLKKLVTEGMELSAYYASVAEAKTPGDEEVRAYYEENRDSYDSVDYRISLISAQLPTEPTELADPVEETKDTAADKTTTDSTASTETEEEYEPSEAEIEFAMNEAKLEAEEQLKRIQTEGDLQTNVQKSNLATRIREWLFDAERKAGDTTIIEDDTNYLYYVLAFENRYLDETPTVDMRVIVLPGETASEEGDTAGTTGTVVTGEAVLEEWKSGAATEESFAQLADKYNSSELISSEGGIIEGFETRNAAEELSVWLDDDARVAGDTVVISPEVDSYIYVLYFVGRNEPAWKLDAGNEVLTDVMADYLKEISAGYEVKDPDKNLYYLQVYAAQEAEAAEAESTEQSTEASGEAATGAE